MADRIPLIVNSSTNQITELPTNDNLNLTSSGIVGVTSIGIGIINPVNPLQVNSGTNVVIVDSQGDLGIGTLTATSKLHVIGDTRISGVVTATSYYGDGSQLTGVTAGTSAGKSIAFSLLFGS